MMSTAFFLNLFEKYVKLDLKEGGK